MSEPSAFLDSRIESPSILCLATVLGGQPLALHIGLERAADVPAQDRGIVDGRRIAVADPESQQNALGCGFFLGLPDVSADQVKITFAVTGHAFPLGPAQRRWRGKLRRSDWLAQDAAGRRVDDEERGMFVVRQQEPPAVADRLDGRRLDHAVDFPAHEQRHRQADRLETELLSHRGGRHAADRADKRSPRRSKNEFWCS